MKRYVFIGYVVATAVVSSSITYAVTEHNRIHQDNANNVCKVYIEEDGFIDVINPSGTVEIFSDGEITIENAEQN